VSDGPRLDWGLLSAFDTDRAVRVPPDLARMWQLAGQSLNLVALPIERFELAGTLNGDPGHVRSDRAKQNFPAIFALAVAGYRAREPLRGYSRAAAGSALLSWATVYRPTGNPVDEWFFVPLLQAADLVASSLPGREQAVLREWAQVFVTAGDRFYDRKAAGNSARANNWMARRLLIRTVGAAVAGDAVGSAEMPGMLREFVARNFVAGPSGRPDGRTFDFVQRDALHYHVAAVQPLVEVALCAPDLVGRTTRAAVLSGLEFLRPFFLGHAEHVEFARTSVAFDRERRDDGNPAFRNAPWEPAAARVLLRLARAAFPQVRAWTEDIVDAAYDPRTKLMAAIYGEPQRRDGWPQQGRPVRGSSI
jgi:Alginate lyase